MRQWELRQCTDLRYADNIGDGLAVGEVPAGSPSRGGDVRFMSLTYVSDINQLSWSTPFYSVLVSIFVFMALSTVFYSINSPDSSPLSHSVLKFLINSALLVLSTIFLYESLPQP